MKFRTVLNLLNIGILSIAINTANAADIFTDSFETGDLSSTGTKGFFWYSNKAVTVISATHEKDYASSTVRLKANALEFPGGDWTPHSGAYSLRFAYAAGKPWSEKRFDIGVPMKDIWIRFWLRVPTNFSYGPKGSPNKLFALWSDGYSSKGDGSTVWLGFHRYNGSDSTFAITYSNGGYTTSNGYQQSKIFVTSTDRGRWMHLVMHFKTESSPGASDGLIQTYRRWQNEGSYTKVHEALNLPIKIPASGQTNGFKRGYILGWANAHYTENTEWLLDDFVISDSSPMSKLTKLPMPPTDFVVSN